MIRVSSGYGPWAVLAAVYVMTVVFTELVTNNAAAALVFPIAVATAHALERELHAVCNSRCDWCFCRLCDAAWLSDAPDGVRTGGYHFSDFVRIGLPLDILCGIVTVTVTPLVYPF